MKTVWVLALLLVAIVMATILHVNKKNDNFIEDDVDELATSLSGLGKYVPTHTNLYLAQYGVDDYLYCRYLLAPRHVSIDPREKPDTQLSICKIDASDSIVKTILDGKKQIWAIKSQKLQFLLTSSH